MKKISSLFSLLALSLASVVFAQGGSESQGYFCLTPGNNGEVTLSQSANDETGENTYCYVDWYVANSEASVVYKLQELNREADGEKLNLKLGSDINFGAWTEVTEGYAAVTCNSAIAFSPLPKDVIASIDGAKSEDERYVIKNLCAQGGFVESLADVSFSNVVFDSAFVYGTNYAGVLAPRWQPSGDASVSNVTVKNSKVYVDGSSNPLAGGLFGEAELENALEIKNVNVDSTTISSGNGSAGGFLGNGTNVSVKNSKVSNTTITASRAAGGMICKGQSISLEGVYADTVTIVADTIGGAVGYLTGSGTVRNFTGRELTFTTTSMPRTEPSYLGGAVGLVNINNESVIVRDITVKGLKLEVDETKVTDVQSTFGNLSAYLGGVVGSYEARIRLLKTFEGLSVTNASIKNGSLMGGLFGKIAKTLDDTTSVQIWLEKAKFQGTIASSRVTYAVAGGLVGADSVIDGADGHKSSITIRKSLSEADIALSGCQTCTVGGFVGDGIGVTDTITNSYHKGNLSAEEGSNARVGYLIGSWSSTQSNVLQNNFHYSAEDAVEFCVGYDANLIAAYTSAYWNRVLTDNPNTISSNARNDKEGVLIADAKIVGRLLVDESVTQINEDVTPVQTGVLPSAVFSTAAIAYLLNDDLSGEGVSVDAWSYNDTNNAVVFADENHQVPYAINLNFGSSALGTLSEYRTTLEGYNCPSEATNCPEVYLYTNSAGSMIEYDISNLSNLGKLPNSNSSLYYRSSLNEFAVEEFDGTNTFSQDVTYMVYVKKPYQVTYLYSESGAYSEGSVDDFKGSLENLEESGNLGFTPYFIRPKISEFDGTSQSLIPKIIAKTVDSYGYIEWSMLDFVTACYEVEGEVDCLHMTVTDWNTDDLIAQIAESALNSTSNEIYLVYKNRVSSGTLNYAEVKNNSENNSIAVKAWGYDMSGELAILEDFTLENEEYNNSRYNVKYTPLLKPEVSTGYVLQDYKATVLLYNPDRIDDDNPGKIVEVTNGTSHLGTVEQLTRNILDSTTVEDRSSDEWRVGWSVLLERDASLDLNNLMTAVSNAGYHYPKPSILTPYVSFEAHTVPLNYNVTFDYSTIPEDTLVIIGEDFAFNKTVTVDDKYSPVMYIYYSGDYNYRGFSHVAWSPIRERKLESNDLINNFDDKTMHVSSMLIDSLPSDNYKKVDDDENVEANFTLFAQIGPTSGTSTADVSEIMVYGEGETGVLSKENHHGKIQLTQHYEEGENLWDRTFDYVDSGSVTVYAFENGDHIGIEAYTHKFYVPWTGSSMKFNLVTDSDAGYAMTIGDVCSFYYENNQEHCEEENCEETRVIPLKYNAEEGSLTILPSMTGDVYIPVSYSLLSAALSYPGGSDGSLAGKDFFVFGDYTEDSWPYNYEYKVPNLQLPRIGSPAGCVGWSTDTEVGDNTVMSLDIDKKLSKTLATGGTNVLNALVKDNCEKMGEDVVDTLKTDGHGTLKMYQVFKVREDENGEAVYDTVVHQFKAPEGCLDDDGCPRIMTIPFVADLKDDSRPMSAKVYLKAVPDEGYVVDAIYYQSTVNGKMVTVMLEECVEDVSECVTQDFVSADYNRTYFVSFKAAGPYYVTYDLNMTAEEMPNVFLPPEVKEKDTLTYSAEQGEVYFWQPVRSDKCFAGWALDRRGAVTYESFDKNMVSVLSDDGVYPTTLYAVWDGDGSGCGDLEDPIVLKDTLTYADARIYQVWKGDTIYHSISEDGLGIPMQSGFSGNIEIAVGVELTAHLGYMLSNPMMEKVCEEENSECQNGVVNADDEGLFVVSQVYTTSMNINSVYYINATVDSSFYFAFDAGSAGAYKLDSWERVREVLLGDELPASLARTDACLAGWNFTANADAGFNAVDENLLTAMGNAEITKLYIDGEEKDGYALYPVWTFEDCMPNVVRVVSGNQAADGFFTLKQEDTTHIDVNVSGVNVPAEVPLYMQFVYNASVKPDVDAMIVVKAFDVDGNLVGEAETLELTEEGVASYRFKKSIGSVDEAILVDHYELSVATDYDDMKFVFDVNSESAVFYGENWKSSESYNLGMTAESRSLPVVYRTDAVLKGWTLSEGGDVFTAFDETLAGQYQDAVVQLGSENVAYLHAVWDEKVKPATYEVVNRTGDDQPMAMICNEKRYGFENNKLALPAAANNVCTISYEPASGYVLDSLKFFDTFGNEIGFALPENLEVTVDQNLIVAARNHGTSYVVAFDVNAPEGAVLFYGEGWTSEKGVDYGGALPITGVYAAGYKLSGWKVVEEDIAHTTFDAQFKEAADALDDGKLLLKAVWIEEAISDENTVRLASANNPDAGVLYVGQSDENKLAVTRDGLFVPLGNGDISLDVSFEAFAGYSVSEGFYTVLDGLERLSPLATREGVATLVLSGDALITAPVTENVYTIHFEINGEGKQVFYDEMWKTTGSYSMSSEDKLFPKAYRKDACLVGWSPETVADAEGVEAFEGFGEKNLMEMFGSEVTEITLYAVWDSRCEQDTVVVRNEFAEKGEIFLVQNVAGGLDTVAVGDSIVLPRVNLFFSAYFTLNAGYEAVGMGSLLQKLDGAYFPLQSSVLVIDGQNAEVKEIVLAIPAEEGNTFEVVFDENTAERVFYGRGWTGAGLFAVNSDFPLNLYRTDAKLKGWKFTRSGQKSYSKFDSEFMEDMKKLQELDINVDTLFADWSYTYDNTNLRVSLDEEEVGRFFIFQNVNETFGAPIEVGKDGVWIPATEDGLEFYVNYEPAAGYTVHKDGFPEIISVMEDMVLKAEVEAKLYNIVLDVNADTSDNVFYGRDWKRSDSYDMANRNEFSREIYQTDKVFVGWSLDKEGSGEKYASLTEELVYELENRESDTLYAVWENAEVETYTVDFANGEAGDLKLAQVVEKDTVEFVVGENGLEVPKVEGGFRFLVAFRAASGYVYDELKDNLVVSVADGDTTVIQDETLVVDANLTISIPLEESLYPVVFNVNSNRKDVIYGDDWVASKVFTVKDGQSQKLPQTIYAADACVVGWSVGADTALYADFGDGLIDALEKSEKSEQGYVLNAVWKDGDACISGGVLERFQKVVLTARNGSVEFLETREGENAQFTVAHSFAEDGTMLLPYGFNGRKLTLHSVADSSYVLESLKMVRESDSNDVYTFMEGDALIGDLLGGVFTANFVKSNKTELAVKLDNMELAGNALRINFSTSAFEVTRQVKARIYVMDGSANIVVDTLFDEPLKKTPAAYEWVHFPFDAGEYAVMVELFDEADSAFADTSFSVQSEITVASDGGWQMVSMAAVDTAALVWDDDPAFFWWDEGDKAGEYWQYKTFAQGDEIVADRGYWYSSLEGRALPLNANAASAEGNTTWALDSVYSGWNLVANPYGWTVNLYNDNRDKACAADEECDVKFYTYDSETGSYVPAVSLKPFEAVWAQVGKNTSWTLKGEPAFQSDMLEDMPEIVERDSAGNVSMKKALAKANARNNWSLQAILSDNRGKKDSWNILGVSSRPFVSEEPPEAQGDHVSLSVKEGQKSLAKSFKAVADSYEWELSLKASSERMGDLTLVGVDGVRSLGYRVYVIVDGKAFEMTEGESVRVALKSRETVATVRVTAGSVNVVAGMLDGLRMSQAGGKVRVGFNVDESLAGSRTVVDVVTLEGKVVATFGSKAQAGYNHITLDAPKSGLYMLRVRVASQQVAGKIMVK
ncbi:MAG: hypothetical protein HUK20_12660 [Fibrobacter sp.]|nr:hypothetical protein [Fibrobacter sp.]